LRWDVARGVRPVRRRDDRGIGFHRLRRVLWRLRFCGRMRRRGLHLWNWLSVPTRFRLRHLSRRNGTPLRYLLCAVVAVLAVACQADHSVGGDGGPAVVCTASGAPTVFTCDATDTQACTTWRDSFRATPAAITRCLRTEVAAQCVRADRCDERGHCTCGFDDVCSDGSACLAFPEGPRCVSCGGT
jgi:hypothetical protein